MMSTVAVLVFLMVTVLELDVFSTTFPKLALVGLKVRGAVAPFCPVPVRPPAATGLAAPAGVMLRDPLMIPFVVGEKLTANVHLDLAASVPLHGVAPAPTAE